MTTTALWTPGPDEAAASNLKRFSDGIEASRRVQLDGFGDLHRWTLDNPGEFWAEVWDFCGVVGERGLRLVAPGDEFWSWRFLPDAKLNVAETLLGPPGDDAALVYRGEDGERTELTRADLHGLVSRLQQAFLDAGVESGDRIAAWLPNRPELYAAMLAAASIGAVFSSCSPDFGTDGVLDRFGQIEPKVLLAAPDYFYGGKRHDCTARLREIEQGLPTLHRTMLLDEGWLDAYSPASVQFTRLPFDHPWYVLFSSGTTGKPKCIVHRAGGLLLKHLSEHILHCDVRPGDRVFYFTTAGWMMFNWLASGLGTGAALVLYDGSPFHPDANAMFDLIDESGITLFGTSAKFIDACRNAGLDPRSTHGLDTLRTITSTGSTLVPEGFDYVYEHIKTDVHLASISGGTDLCGCLVAGDPTRPVHRGEIQAPTLGLDIDVVDDDGESVPIGASGELVCRSPFPSMPLHFWGDADGSRYRAAYFERIPGVWRHGDFAARTEAGGFVISGRSDATLNPGGVRIGTAEIYRRVESMPEVDEAVVIGQRWDNDTRVVLFVRMAPGAELTDELGADIRSDIRTAVSPRHVPAVIAEVADIPRTRSGKISELAVRAVVHREPVKNTEALANPEALAHFADHPSLVTR